jgi:quinone-modifying oxidoreductase subunit QmoA
MASLKQVTYLRGKLPESKSTVFYIDLRTPGRYEKFYQKIKEDENVSFVKGKVAKIEEDPSSGAVTVTAEDAIGGDLTKVTVDMVVLATGMEPSTEQARIPGNASYDENNFLLPGDLIPAGVAKKPGDVVLSAQSSTGAALKAIQNMVRR